MATGFEVGVGRNILGYEQLAPTNGAAITLTAAKVALLIPGYSQVNIMNESTGGDVRFRCDGTAPTTTIGTLLPAGSEVVLTDAEAAKFKVIATAGNNGALDVRYIGL